VSRPMILIANHGPGAGCAEYETTRDCLLGLHSRIEALELLHEPRLYVHDHAPAKEEALPVCPKCGRRAKHFASDRDGGTFTECPQVGHPSAWSQDRDGSDRHWRALCRGWKEGS
jgi:hypothetical protein